MVANEPCKSTGASISGLSFYTGASYPNTYHGALFCADYTRTCIWAIPQGSNGLPDNSKIKVIEANIRPVDLEIGPGGDVFYVDLLAGEIHRLQANQPEAVATATPDHSDTAPLTVSLDGSGSTDPNGSALTYAWDLDNDGNFNDATGVTTSATFSAEGQYTVRLKVTDSRASQT